MAKIQGTTFPDKDLSIFTIEGSASREDMLQAVINMQDGQRTRDIIWDASNGTVERIEQADLKKITGFLKQGHGMRPGGRTALVGPDDLNFGIGRMFQAYTDMENLSVEYKTFRNMEAALEWINSPRE